MSLSGCVRRLGAVARAALTAAARTRIGARALRPVFERRVGSCWNVFDTFRQAADAAPASRPLGYDNDQAAAMYRDLHVSVEAKDYAVAFWLQRRLQPGHQVLDFGGHVGTKYYALQTVLPLPEGVTWVIHDVPAVVAAGRRLAAERGAGRLHFADTLAEISRADVFLALGSLQYLEAPLPSILQQLTALPRYVIVSSMPMSDRRYVTLQNIGASYCPYLIEDRDAVVRGMSELGYELMHSWRNPEKSCRILGRPDRSVEGYTSMYFALAREQTAG